MRQQGVRARGFGRCWNAILRSNLISRVRPSTPPTYMVFVSVCVCVSVNMRPQHYAIARTLLSYVCVCSRARVRLLQLKYLARQTSIIMGLYYIICTYYMPYRRACIRSRNLSHCICTTVCVLAVFVCYCV